MELDKKKILEIQKNRDPYLFIDHVTDFELKKFAFGYKYLNNDDWFFKVHWENDPNMPGFADRGYDTALRNHGFGRKKTPWKGGLSNYS